VPREFDVGIVRQVLEYVHEIALDQLVGAVERALALARDRVDHAAPIPLVDPPRDVTLVDETVDQTRHALLGDRQLEREIRLDGATAQQMVQEAVLRHAWVQCCVVHLIRTSLKHVSYKDQKAIVKDLRPIYQAPSDEAAAGALEAFDQIWGGRYPMIAETWRRNWERVIPFLAFPADIRRIIYTTNSIEAVNRQLRKIIKTRGHFPTEDAALKLLWLAVRNAEKKWTYPIKEWQRALHQFAIYFPGRVTVAS
jgi:Transposase, Mutator family